MDVFVKFIIVAILIEAIWESAKMVWVDGKFSASSLGVLCLGVFVCIVADVDFLAAAGIGLTIPYVGCFLTGFIVSRGSNFIHDVISKIGSGEEPTEE